MASRRARRPRGGPRFVQALLLVLGGLASVHLYRQWPASADALQAAAEPAAHAASALPAHGAGGARAAAVEQRAELGGGGAIQGERQHEVLLSVFGPPELQPLLATEPQLTLPKKCRARAHTELEGGVVKWGTDHRVADAGACCEACALLQAKGCNVWVFCGDKEKCGDRLGQCWLKHTEDPTEPISRGSSQSVPWTSGTLLQEPKNQLA